MLSCCHSERSEESLMKFMSQEILHGVQNDSSHISSYFSRSFLKNIPL